MKMSTLIFICLTAVFISVGGLFDDPARILLYIASAICATAALVSALKGAKRNGGRKKKD